MNEKHYKEKLSSFVNHELPGDERQAIAEHLLLCANCRKEHDEIKFGAGLASNLKQTDAPADLWRKIEKAMDGEREKEKTSLIPNFAFFASRGLISAVGLLIVCGLIAAVYFGLSRNNSPEIVKNDPLKNQPANLEMPQVSPTPNEVSVNRKPPPQEVSNINSNLQNPPEIKVSNIQNPPKAGTSNARTLAKNSPVERENKPNQTIPAPKNLPSWKVETLAGTPTTNNRTIAENGKLTVGEFLETDANSKAKIQVADIGNVEIAPNSRVKLVKTTSSEHRLSLEKGKLKAKILAPPRLFIVDTPSAVAVDLGCEYTLEVDAEGNGRLHVTGGFVALERNGRESIVPAGAIALTRKGNGIGTPFSEDASPKFQDALYKFDFENGGGAALQTIIKESGLYDSLTLWHLLSRVEKPERVKVFDALAAQIKPPAAITREGILKLDKKMLDAWWKEIESVWFE